MGLDLFLFTVDPATAVDVVAAGAAGVVVDWERRGKHRRQLGEGTQVNEHTPADLAAVRAAAPAARVLCRVDAVGPHTPAQVDLAVALGADEVLVPMVRRPADVDRALQAAAGRVGVGILVETQDAVTCAAELARRPLSRVYVGLNDLRIDRGSSALFTPLVDGTVEQVRGRFAVPFGVAGLTRVDRGAPVPTRLLVAELARLDASFTFLRRSFSAEVRPDEFAVEVPRMAAAVAAARRRTEAEVRADRHELLAAVGAPVPQVA